MSLIKYLKSYLNFKENFDLEKEKKENKINYLSFIEKLNAMTQKMIVIYYFIKNIDYSIKLMKNLDK